MECASTRLHYGVDWQRGHQTLRRQVGLKLTVTPSIQSDVAEILSTKSVNNIWIHDLRPFLIVPILVWIASWSGKDLTELATTPHPVGHLDHQACRTNTIGYSRFKLVTPLILWFASCRNI
jgi:hypothetical protein